MDRHIDTTATKQRVVGRIHNGIDLLSTDVPN
jgi:hypothetical protein